MRTRAVTASVLLAVLVLVAAACTSQYDPVVQASQSSNDADIAFIRSLLDRADAPVAGRVVLT